MSLKILPKGTFFKGDRFFAPGVWHVLEDGLFSTFFIIISKTEMSQWLTGISFCLIGQAFLSFFFKKRFIWEREIERAGERAEGVRENLQQTPC